MGTESASTPSSSQYASGRGYLSHFCLVSDPFSLTPDPRFLFVSETHAEAMAAMDLALMERRGLTVVVGEVGTGKTTLAYHMLKTAGSGFHLAYVTNTTLSFVEILETVLDGFGVTARGHSKKDLLVALTEFVMTADQRDETVAIIVDEAQNLSPQVLEEFRLLLNLETAQRKLLQIVLLGQPELHEMLQRPHLRHLADRIAVRCFINPLSPADCQSYIDHRLLCAAGPTEAIGKRARRRIIRESKGIPRALNILCHNALLFAFGRGGDRVEPVDANLAIREKRGRGLVVNRLRWHFPPAVWVPACVALGALAVLAPALLLGGPERRGDVGGDAVRAPVSTSEAARPVAESEPTVRAESLGTESLGTAMTAAADPAPLGARLGQGREGQVIVRLERAATLQEMVLAMYGTTNDELLEMVRSANPVLAQGDELRPGLVVSFPQPGMRSATLELP